MPVSNTAAAWTRDEKKYYRLTLLGRTGKRNPRLGEDFIKWVDDIKTAVIAFANTDGGKIYIRMNHERTVLGVADVDGTMLRVTNMARDVVRPDVTMFMDCGVEAIDDKQVIVVMKKKAAVNI